jgi:hypothetical protein
MKTKLSTSFLCSPKKIAHAKYAYFAFLIGICLFLCSCAPKAPQIPEVPQIKAQKVWSLFKSRNSLQNQNTGFSLKASVHLLSEKHRNRFLTRMWGNFQLPIRMDLQTGFGSTFAYYREDSQEWLAYHPKQEKAFIHSDSSLGFKALGVQTPFNLQELAWVLGGYWHRMLPLDYESQQFIPQKGWLFSLSEQNKISKVLLGAKGQVLALFGQKPSEWQVSVSDREEREGRDLPTKYTLQIAEHTQLRIYLRSYKTKNNKWSKAALDLSLPEDTHIIELQRPALFPGI